MVGLRDNDPFGPNSRYNRRPDGSFPDPFKDADFPSMPGSRLFKTMWITVSIFITAVFLIVLGGFVVMGWAILHPHAVGAGAGEMVNQFRNGFNSTQ